MAGSSGGKKGGRKIGRGMKSPSHNQYNTMGRREQNKIRKLKKHIKEYGNDKIALKCLRKLNA